MLIFTNWSLVSSLIFTLDYSKMHFFTICNFWPAFVLDKSYHLSFFFRYYVFYPWLKLHRTISTKRNKQTKIEILIPSSRCISYGQFLKRPCKFENWYACQNQLPFFHTSKFSIWRHMCLVGFPNPNKMEQSWKYKTKWARKNYLIIGLLIF